jgi:hypothetical protein
MERTTFGVFAMAIARVIQESVRGCSTVAFDQHALQRMQERGITEDEVLDVLRHPTQTGLPTTDESLPPAQASGSAGLY